MFEKNPGLVSEVVELGVGRFFSWVFWAFFASCACFFCCAFLRFSSIFRCFSASLIEAASIVSAVSSW